MTGLLERRAGPRPLGLHLQTALATWLTSPAGLLNSRPELLRSKAQPSPLASLGENGRAEPFLRALDGEVRRRLDLLLDGIERYRHHPYRRDLADPPALWAEGTTRLLDYGGSGAPLLLIPSLINRGYILDLSAETSFARWLRANGFHPYLIDWGEPGEAERGFVLTDYIAGRLERALDAILAEGSASVAALGYCMGGMLATALAARRQDDLSCLTLMATPWDFHASDADRATRLAAWYDRAQPAVERWGELPIDAIQALFAALDPMLVARKFIRFAEMDAASSKADAFVALEDWLNDGVPLVAGVARECLTGWYGRNEPASGAWRVGGRAVEPAQLNLPTLALIPSTDRIVPPASAAALANAVPNAEIRSPPLGHIGMIVASGAETQLWQPLAGWLRAHS